MRTWRYLGELLNYPACHIQTEGSSVVDGDKGADGRVYEGAGENLGGSIVVIILITGRFHILTWVTI